MEAAVTAFDSCTKGNRSFSTFRMDFAKLLEQQTAAGVTIPATLIRLRFIKAMKSDKRYEAPLRDILSARPPPDLEAIIQKLLGYAETFKDLFVGTRSTRRVDQGLNAETTPVKTKAAEKRAKRAANKAKRQPRRALFKHLRTEIRLQLQLQLQNQDQFVSPTWMVSSARRGRSATFVTKLPRKRRRTQSRTTRRRPAVRWRLPGPVHEERPVAFLTTLACSTRRDKLRRWQSATRARC